MLVSFFLGGGGGIGLKIKICNFARETFSSL